MSLDSKIEQIIKKVKAGSLFVYDDFREMGTQSAIHTTLHRIVKRGLLVRMAHGVYAKPYLSEHLDKQVLPSAEDVAAAIAKRDNAKIIPSGSYAMFALGLTTQMPLKLVYYTDGKVRTVKVGKRTIQFKRTTPKKLALKGKISKLAVLALSAIGKSKVTSDDEDKVVKLLLKENIKDLKHDISLAPQWIAEIMSKAIHR